MSESSAESRIREYLSLSEGVGAVGTGGPVRFHQAFKDMIRLFEHTRTCYAIIGAFGVAAYVRELRSTQDIDVVAPPESTPLLRASAPSFGFEVETEDEQAPIQRFLHSTGVRLDLLFNPPAFANLDCTVPVRLAGIGTLQIASVADVAYCKLQTQDPMFNRRAEKRKSDMADLIALLRENHDLPSILSSMASNPHYLRGRSTSRRSQALAEACSAAGIRIPAPMTASRRVLLMAAAFLVILLGVAAIVAVLDWLWPSH